MCDIFHLSRLFIENMKVFGNATAWSANSHENFVHKTSNDNDMPCTQTSIERREHLCSLTNFLSLVFTSDMTKLLISFKASQICVSNDSVSYDAMPATITSNVSKSKNEKSENEFWWQKTCFSFVCELSANWCEGEVLPHCCTHTHIHSCILKQPSYVRVNAQWLWICDSFARSYPNKQLLFAPRSHPFSHTSLCKCVSKKSHPLFLKIQYFNVQIHWMNSSC